MFSPQLGSWELCSISLGVVYVLKIFGILPHRIFICFPVSFFDFAKFPDLSFSIMLEKMLLLDFWDFLAVSPFPTYIWTFNFISVFLHPVQFWLHSQPFLLCLCLWPRREYCWSVSRVPVDLAVCVPSALIADSFNISNRQNSFQFLLFSNGAAARSSEYFLSLQSSLILKSLPLSAFFSTEAIPSRSVMADGLSLVSYSLDFWRFLEIWRFNLV